jgi:hypothetical protein
MGNSILFDSEQVKRGFASNFSNRRDVRPARSF